MKAQRIKRKPRTAEFYRDILDRIVKPAVGTTKADKLTGPRSPNFIPRSPRRPFRPTAYWPLSGACTPLRDARALCRKAPTPR